MSLYGPCILTCAAPDIVGSTMIALFPSKCAVSAWTLSNAGGERNSIVAGDSPAATNVNIARTLIEAVTRASKSTGRTLWNRVTMTTSQS